MSKAVLISIQPKWCELIASNIKKNDARKSYPKIETPFKCYIYQSKKSWVYNIYSKIADWQGKIIGEFMCDVISEYWFLESDNDDIEAYEDIQLACLTAKEILEYGNEKTIYFWHISDLVIYEESKDLSEFRKPIDCHRGISRENCVGCWDCEITRPPQSWCYVEELGDKE